jgi:L-threonylcarbamoyladenylate synthase
MGADPRSGEGLDRLLRVKGRQEGRPVPLLIDSAASAAAWASEVSPAARRLMARFWPGALTLVLPAAKGLLPAITGGGGTVGLRMPDHPVSRALARALGGAVTGTSANRSGRESAWENADALVEAFAGEADWILWDRPVAAGAAASTVVRVDGGATTCIREGALPFRTITDFLQGGP